MFDDKFRGSVKVIMERHGFAIRDDTKSELEKDEMKWALVRRLAWLLKEPQDSNIGMEVANPKSGTTPMCLLPCMGYYSTQNKKKPIELCLVYEVPQDAGTLTTLHDWISRPQDACDLRVSELESALETERTKQNATQKALQAHHSSLGRKERSTMLRHRTNLMEKGTTWRTG